MKFQLVRIVFLLFILTSCADKKAQWLEQYAQTKCAYQTEEDKIKSDSIEQIPSLIAERLKLQEQLSIITTPFEKKIEELNEEIKEAQREYMKSYRKAEEAQNAKFGHQNTPAYEKEINRLDIIKSTKIATVQNKIAEVKSEMESNANYKSIIDKITNQDKKIKVTQETIINNHKTTIDSLQELLNVQNSNYKRMKSELAPAEQIILELKRDSIRTKPCTI
jgi:hypothetical protein